MVEGLPKPLRHCTPSDLRRHSEVRAVRSSQATRLYSIGLLEEAYKLSKKVGITEAARLAEVNRHSLSHYVQVKRLEEGHVPVPSTAPNRIPHDKKKKCLAMAKVLFTKKFSKSMRKCWIEAGRRFGINGRSVEFQYNRGLWKP